MVIKGATIGEAGGVVAVGEDLAAGSEDLPEDMDNCMGITPPDEGGTEDSLDDEAGLGLLLGSLPPAVSSLSWPGLIYSR